MRLDTDERAAVFVAEGLGHAFVALTDDATVVYLCSEVYAPAARARHPSARPRPRHRLAGRSRAAADPDAPPDADAAAPTLQEAADAGLLPPSPERPARSWYAQLRG